MKHYIIVKWNDSVTDKARTAEQVRSLYEGAAEIPGIFRVTVEENITPRDNRYDLMIMLEMKDEVLPVWDDSALHKQWKEEFGGLIRQKAIFDSASAGE